MEAVGSSNIRCAEGSIPEFSSVSVISSMFMSAYLNTRDTVEREKDTTFSDLNTGAEYKKNYKNKDCKTVNGIFFFNLNLSLVILTCSVQQEGSASATTITRKTDS